MSSTLAGDHQDTFEAIFRHPISHNLEWRSLTSLFNELGELHEEPNGKLKFTRNGKTLTMHTHGKDVGVDEIMHVRHFLESSEEPIVDSLEGGNDFVVVLDHAGARIYQLGADAPKAVHIEPYDPEGHDQQVHNPEGDSGGQQGPNRKLFYENLAQHLLGANRILMIGDGLGASSEIDRFLEIVKRHHHELEERVIGKESVDLQHLTEGEILAKAREVFESQTPH